MYSARFLLYRVTERFISPIYTICRLLQTPADFCRLLQTPADSTILGSKTMYSAPFLLYRVTERFISPIYTICRLLQTFADSWIIHYFGFKNHVFWSLFTIPN